MFLFSPSGDSEIPSISVRVNYKLWILSPASVGGSSVLASDGVRWCHGRVGSNVNAISVLANVSILASDGVQWRILIAW